MRRHGAKASLKGVNGINNDAYQTLQGDQHARTTVRLGHTSPRSLRPLLRCIRPGPGQDRGTLGREDRSKYESDDAVFQDRVSSSKSASKENTTSQAWVDFFAPAHFDEFPQLHDLFWKAVHQAGEAKKSMDPAVGEQLVSYIDEIADIFWKTDKGQQMGVYPPA